MTFHVRTLQLRQLTAAALCFAAFGMARADDPFGTANLLPPAPGRPWTGGADPCANQVQAGRALTLADVIDRALCANPQTRQSWAASKIQAAEVGRSRSAGLPDVTLNGEAGLDRTWPSGGSTLRQDRVSATATVSYLLFDSGARDANLESARQLLAAANWSHSATLQAVFLSAIQNYYQLIAARANVTAATEAEKASLESLKAAEFRYRVGTGTPADRLQAQTAYSQTQLTRTRAEGDARTAAGALANSMGMDADTVVEVAPPRIEAPDFVTESALRELVEYARTIRPDLAAADAKLQAARAQVRAAQAAGKPTVSLTASAGIGNSNTLDNFSTGAIGISLSVPIFTGYRNTYEIRSAQAQVEAREADRDVLRSQISLDVWKAWQSLATERTALANAEDLLRSALESDNVVRARYRAGAGTLIDLLAAQSALASARFQNIQAQYNWHLSKVALASALGTLDLASLAANADTIRIDTSRTPPRK
jgi:TolC family type I secretion outer membrane protein